MGYLGCKECIKEKRKDASRIDGTGGAWMFVGGKCIISCVHHNLPLVWIEERELIENKILEVEKKE